MATVIMQYEVNLGCAPLFTAPVAEQEEHITPNPAWVELDDILSHHPLHFVYNQNSGMFRNHG